MKTLFVIIFTILSFNSFADLLMIGDSHTVGPFGDHLHKNLAKGLNDKIIMVYGHSSSAPIHWMSETPVVLSGGINHHISYQDIFLQYFPDWRIKQPTLNLISLLDNPIIHSDWVSKIPLKPNIDTIIIALGANDRAAVATPSGARTSEFKKRLEILDGMLNQIGNRGINCIWIGPPSSIKETKLNEQTTHEYLLEGIKNRCPFFDSRKFVAKFCDQVHFSCKEGTPTAKEWANEASEFIFKNL